MRAGAYFHRSILSWVAYRWYGVGCSLSWPGMPLGAHPGMDIDARNGGDTLHSVLALCPASILGSILVGVGAFVAGQRR